MSREFRNNKAKNDIEGSKASLGQYFWISEYMEAKMEEGDEELRQNKKEFERRISRNERQLNWEILVWRK